MKMVCKMLIHLPSSFKPLDKAINCGTIIQKIHKKIHNMTTVPNYVTQNFFRNHSGLLCDMVT